MYTIFNGLHDDAFFNQLAKEVALGTRLHLPPPAAGMNVAELRGYLRARLRSHAQEKVRQSVAQVHLPPQKVSELTAAVLERAIHLVIRDLFVNPIISIPTPHVSARAA
jgi:hypothetical protein